MARTLAALVEHCRGLEELEGLDRGLFVTHPDALWSRPHDSRFDFAGTTVGADWIDQLAAQARAVRDQPPAGQLVVGHTDWRAENMRFHDDQVSVVYDWDSLTVLPEPVLVGSTANAFPSDWSVEDSRQFPTVDEALAYAHEYEAARRRPFTDGEWRVLRAALVYAMAYTARCEHSDALTDFGDHPPRIELADAAPDPDGARAWLGAHGPELLQG